MFVLLASIKINAQTFTTYADTANYLISQIENKKSQYIGKSFSVVYDSLKIKPVFAIAEYTSKKEDFGKVLRLYFNYLYRDFSKTHIFIVTFDSCPPYNTLHSLLFPTANQPFDMSAVINLYKPLIIKDIVLKDYQQDDPVNPDVIQQQE
jgi:hypothetical protein